MPRSVVRKYYWQLCCTSFSMFEYCNNLDESSVHDEIERKKNSNYYDCTTFHFVCAFMSVLWSYTDKPPLWLERNGKEEKSPFQSRCIAYKYVSNWRRMSAYNFFLFTLSLSVVASCSSRKMFANFRVPRKKLQVGASNLALSKLWKQIIVFDDTRGKNFRVYMVFLPVV